MLTKNVLFIAYGNPLRRDDSAGIELARRVASAIRAQHGHPSQFAIHLLELQQLVPELVNDIADPSVASIVFFDCRMQEAEGKEQDARGKIKLCNLQPATCNLQPATFTHYLTPQTLLAITAALYGHVSPASLVTIPGYDFGIGEGFSSEVKQLFEDTPEIATMILKTTRFSEDQVASKSVG